MIPPREAGSRSTIEVIHGSERRQPTSASNQRTLRARVSSIPIMVVGAAGPSASAAAATSTRWTVHHATPWSLSTSLIARFVVLTASLIFVRNRAVSRARVGSCTRVSVNDRRADNASVHANRRLRTHIRSGTAPCGRSLTRLVGRSRTSPDSTPQDGQPPCSVTRSTSTRRAPSASNNTSRTRNPGSANNKAYGRTELVALFS